MYNICPFTHITVQIYTIIAHDRYLMPKKRHLIHAWPPIVAGTRATTRAVTRAVAAGELRPIGLNLYTPELHGPIDEVVRHHWYLVLNALLPGAVISFRTALEAKPASDDAVFLVGSSRYERNLAGLKIRVVKGPGPLSGDMPFLGELHIASRPRALLDALRPSRCRGTVARGLRPAEIEAVLEREFQSGGERGLNQIRDDAAAIAPALDAQREYDTLAKIISTLLGSRAGTLRQPAAIARLAGDPYDPDRLALFHDLFAYLISQPASFRPTQPEEGAFRNCSFFDAYFSNFIEGTEFEVDEARAIVFDHIIPRARPEDAHDILGTYALVGSRTRMSTSVRDDATAADFAARVRQWHTQIMGGRPDKRPGQWKELPNRAGDTRFVVPALVLGTLRRGFDLFRALDHAFHRAAAMMFLIAEVHPFDDGNGRLARAFMNAELVSAGETRIIIPSVYREEYLTGLRVLSRSREPQVLAQVLDYAQRYTAAIDWSGYAAAELQLITTRAFEKPRLDLKLRMPPAR